MSESYVLCASCGVHRLSSASSCPGCDAPLIARTSRSKLLAAALGASLTVTVSVTGCDRVNPAMSHYGGPPIEEIETPNSLQDEPETPQQVDMGRADSSADAPPPTAEAYGAPPIDEPEEDPEQPQRPIIEEPEP